MKQQLRLGSESIKVVNKSFGRAYILFQLVADTGAGVDDSTNIDLSKVRISIDLKQGGVRETSSFNAVAPVGLGRLKTISSNFSNAVNIDTASGVTCQGQYIGDDGGAINYRNVQVPLLWNGYNLSADDCITFNIDQIPGLYNTACATASTAYLVIEEANDVVQTDINLPYYYPITADKNSPSFTVKGASEVMIISNTLKPNFQDSIFTALEIRSGSVNDRFDLYTLAQLRYDRAIDLSSPLYESTNVYNVEPSALNDVQVDLAVNTTSVVDGAQFLFISKVLFAGEMAYRALAKTSEIQNKKLKLRGLGIKDRSVIRGKY
jgi:hypothetical protein